MATNMNLRPSISNILSTIKSYSAHLSMPKYGYLSYLEKISELQNDSKCGSVILANS